MQRGMGGYTLCKNCNNNTGHWYVDNYAFFINLIRYVVENEVYLKDIKRIKLKIDNIYPLRIIKQVLCMFVSTMHSNFLDVHEDLREFILNKESRKFDIKKYRIGMYLLKENHNSWSGLNIISYGQNKLKTIAYMDMYPVGYILELNPTDEKIDYITDITNMAIDFDYDSKVMMEIDLNVLERNTFFPADFRSKEEIKISECINKIKMVNEIENEMKKLKIDKYKYKNTIRKFLENKMTVSELFFRIEELKKEEK